MKFPLFTFFTLRLAAIAHEPISQPLLDVTPADILSSHTIDTGERRITFQKLDPAAMERKERRRIATATVLPVAPPVPEPAAEPVPGKPGHQSTLGTSVHIADGAHPENALTFLQIRPATGEPPFSLWVNANFLWLGAVPRTVETATARHELMILASSGAGEIPADLPFPDPAKASLVIAEGNPTEEQLAPIDRLLELYDREKTTLRDQYLARVRQAEENARLRALDPPEKKDLIIRYWRADPAGRAEAVREGGIR